MWKLKLFMILSALAAACLLFACAPAAGKDIAISATYDELVKQKNLVKDINASTGDTITVKLFSNKSTGFSWAENMQVTDTKVLQQTSHNYVASKSEGRVGAGGEEIWTLKALAPGKSTASVEYSQPWAGGMKAEWTFKMNVTVK